MSDLQTNLFINGEYSPSSSGDTLAIYSPVDDSVVSDKVQVASEADVDRAVAAARAAFPAWRDTAGHKRAACMFKFAEILEREAERLAGLGRSLAFSLLSWEEEVAFVPVCCKAVECVCRETKGRHC
jgi:aldehyde dehydrogenase (NAD+)